MLIGGLFATAIGLVVLLAAEHSGYPARFVAKPLASIGFLLVALSSGWPGTVAAGWIVAGLILCAVGDVALLGDGKRWFLAGLVTFALGHLALVVGFGYRAGEVTVEMVGAGIVAAALALVVARWLLPEVDAEMRVPVVVYMVLITAMVTASVGAVEAGAAPVIAVGAVMFWLSDIAVARQQFVTEAFLNRLWGLPMYYGGQVLLAWAVAGGQI